MGKQKEGQLQERIQKLIESKGGYAHKNWGNMTSEPGVADITACYKGMYLALEVKVDDNKPSKQQGIHCRMVQKAGGITAILWHIEELETILKYLDIYEGVISPKVIQHYLTEAGIDDGTRW